MKRRGKAIRQRTKVAHRAAASQIRPARLPAKARPAPATGLRRELNAALEQLTATSEVLRIISSAPGQLEPVFQTILVNATRICEAKFANLWLREGDSFRIAATHGAPSKYRKFFDREPVIFPDPRSGLGVIVRTKQLVHVTDIKSAPINKDRMRNATIKLANARSLVGVPLLKENEVVGAIVIYRQEVRRFTGKQIQLLTNFATQAVIAIENARLLRELRLSLQQQTATADVLKVINRSTFDLQVVLDTLTESAARLCRADQSAIRLVKDNLFYHVASYGSRHKHKERMEREPLKPGRGSIVGRVVLEGKTVHHIDALSDPNPEVANRSRSGNVRSVLGVPLLCEGTPIGVLLLQRSIVQPFTDKEIALAETFADQAVIAIENTRLFEAEQQRTQELTESLARQTATSEILRVISQSPTDARPVFDSIVLTAVRLLRCDLVFVLLCDSATISPAAVASPEGPLADVGPTNLPIDPNANFPSRAILDKNMLHLPDWSLIDLPEHERAIREKFGVNSALYLPLLREGECIGLLTLVGKRPNSFGPSDVAQAESFRDQALIAIENSRLFNETKEALEQQTATSEVLQVISGSPGDLEPVFQTMLKNAVRICDAKFGNIHLWDGDAFHLVGVHNTPLAFAEERKRLATFRPSPKTGIGRMLKSKAVVQIVDLAAETTYTEERIPQIVAGVELGGVRTVLFVPMLKENEVVGAFTVYRQ